MNRPHDRIDLLDTFVKIAETGSISAAARSLRATQPTVSRRLLDLERLLGCKLAVRSTSSFCLTHEGLALVDEARRLSAGWLDLLDRLGCDRVVPEGTLRVVGASAWGFSFLMNTVTDLQQRYPRLRVEMTLHDGFIDLLGSGAECWVFPGPPRDASLVVRKLGTMERFLIAAPTLLERIKCVEPHDLTSLPFVGLDPYVLEEVALQAPCGAEERVPLNPHLIVDNLLASYRAVLNGAGIGAVAPWLCTEDLNAGRVVRVLPGWWITPIEVQIAMPMGTHRPARLLAFIETLQRHLMATPGFVPVANP